jgi:hypothetical protein
MSKDVQFLVIAGETTKNNSTYIDRIVGIYQQWPSAQRAAKRVGGVVKTVPYYDGKRTIK